MLHRFPRRLLLGAALAVAACAPKDGGRTLVFAASSLTEAFQDLARAFEASQSGGPVALHFAGTPTLVLQLAEGAPAAVLAAADLHQMERASALGLLAGDPVVFARNGLAIATAPGNPLGIAGLADLARADLRVALCAPNVPAGRYAREALKAAQVRVRSRSDEPSVRALVSKVALGELDAAVVYRTDALAAGASVGAVEIRAEACAAYPIAALKGAPRGARGSAFVRFAASDEGRAILSKHGFRGPE